MRFQRQAEQIVEWKLNDLRVKQERVLMRQAGHAVPLPSGVCSAVIGVSNWLRDEYFFASVRQ